VCHGGTKSTEKWMKMYIEYNILLPLELKFFL